MQKQFIEFLILCSLFVLIQSLASNQSATEGVGLNLNETKQVALQGNGTKHFVATAKLRSVLIINHELSALRTKRKKKKSAIKTLQYEEYDKDGKLLNLFVMRSLADVVTFFKTFLDTTICEVQCD